MIDFKAYDIALIPIIVSLVSILRYTFKLPKRWLPLLSIALGEIAAFVYVSPDHPKKAALVGIVMGLSAIGAWSGVKNTVKREIKQAD